MAGFLADRGPVVTFSYILADQTDIIEFPILDDPFLDIPRPRLRFASCNYPMSPGAGRARPSQSAGPDQPAHFVCIPSFPLEPARKCEALDAAPASAPPVRAGREFLAHRRASGITIIKLIDIKKDHPAVGQPANDPLS